MQCILHGIGNGKILRPLRVDMRRLIAAAEQQPALHRREHLLHPHGIRLAEDLVGNRSHLAYLLMLCCNGEVTHIRPLRAQCLCNPPRNGARRTNECSVIAELAPEALAFIDTQEVLTCDALDLLLCSIAAGSGQCAFDLREPPSCSRASVWGKRRNIGHAADALKQAGTLHTQLIMHHDIECRTRQIPQLRSGHITTEDRIHHIPCHFKQTDKFMHIILAVVVGTRHADQIDRIRLWCLTRRRKCLKRGVRRLVPPIRKAADQSTAVEHNDWADDSCPACNRLDIVTDQPRRTAADDGKQRGRLLHIGGKHLVQIRLRTKYDCIIVELRADHAMRDRRLTVFDVAHRKEITPERSVDDDHRILDAREKRRCTGERTGVRTHADIIKRFFALTHRSDLPCSHDGAVSASYRPAADTPSTSRPRAAVQGRSDAASRLPIRA